MLGNGVTYYLGAAKIRTYFGLTKENAEKSFDEEDLFVPCRSGSSVCKVYLCNGKKYVVKK